MSRIALLTAGVIAMLPLSGCFATPPQVVSLNPNNGSTNVAGDLPLTVIFDHRVDQASVMNRFSITPPLPGCDLAPTPAAGTAPPAAPCRVRWLEGGTKLVIEHFGSPFAPNTKYTLQLKSGFFDAGGVANSLDHRWELTSGTAPRLTGSVPGEAAHAVSVDSPVTLSFSTYMAVAATAASVTLSPPVPDSRVVPNARDHGRFVLLPGRLLRPGQDYTVMVGPSATDEHGLHLVAPAVLHFRTGGLDHGRHALVRAGRAGELPSALLLARLGDLQPDDPAGAATVLRAPRCQRLICGALEYDQALQGYTEAVVSPDASRLAVIAVDQADRAAPSTLLVEDLPGGAQHVAARGAAHASWSADSARLAYAGADGIHILTLATGANVLLPGGNALNAPAQWAADGETLVLPVTVAGGVPGVDLADAGLQIRYALPSALPLPLTRPLLSPQGDVLAVRRIGDASVAGTWILRLTGGDSTPRRLGADLTPVDWVDDGTLLAVADNDGAPGLVRVSATAGDRTPVGGPGIPDLGSVAVEPSGRQLAYLGDLGGATQAFVENADGSNATPLTAFAQGTLQAQGISFGG